MVWTAAAPLLMLPPIFRLGLSDGLTVSRHPPRGRVTSFRMASW